MATVYFIVLFFFPFFTNDEKEINKFTVKPLSATAKEDKSCPRVSTVTNVLVNITVSCVMLNEIICPNDFVVVIRVGKKS